MTDTDILELKKWFDSYTGGYYSDDEQDQRNILLKIEHTRHVCRNIVAIAKGSSLTDNQVRTAEAIALFHDIGRFPQYARYKTFRDADSLNHGLLGAETLISEKTLQGLPEEERRLIIQTVKFHNAFAIPAAFNGDSVLFLKLIRDADKLDIYRVFADYYESPESERASATAFGVPDSPEYSEVMLASIFKKQVASYSNIKTENDFKLMKLSWVFDMHFDESLRLLKAGGHMERIIARLPQTEPVKEAVELINEYVSERLIHG